MTLRVKSRLSDKLLILYITNNDRLFVFDRFIYEVKNAYCKDDIHLLIVNTTNDDSYSSRMAGIGIAFTIASVPCPQSDYLPKIRYGIDFAKKHGFKYMMKCDNDIIIPGYTLDFMFANRSTLDTGLTLSPSLSTGIPAVEYFIDSLFTPEDAERIRREFKQCEFHDQKGIFDYRPLNACTIGAEKWNPITYFKTLRHISDSMVVNSLGRDRNGYSKFYRGIHPVRHGFGNALINELILKNRDKLFSHKQCYIVEEENTYLCDMCFMISTFNYDKLINVENLTIDGCDEVPLNRYSWTTGMKHRILLNGYAIHITYNWRWFLNNVDGGSNIEKPTESITAFEEAFVHRLYERKFELCIMYLTSSDRHHIFKHTAKALSESVHADRIHVLVLTHDDDADFYISWLNNASISYTVKKIKSDDANYMNKIYYAIDFAENRGIPYILKHDNDIIMGSSVYDHIFEQKTILQDDSRLILTPTITSGIPTCELFIEDYMEAEEKAFIYGLFKQHSFGYMWDGLVDYKSLNTYTTGASEWNSSAFYRGVHAIQHYYKGIHPIRVNEKALVELNKIVIKYKDRILQPDTYTLWEDTTSPYFCNSIFCIRTDVYKKIVNAKELFVDGVDEVPLNRWRFNNKQSIVVIRRGTAIHLMYNCIPNYLKYETEFEKLI